MAARRAASTNGSANGTYDADAIQTLEGLEVLRS